MWCVTVCDLENLKNEEAMTRLGSQRHSKKEKKRRKKKQPRVQCYTRDHDVHAVVSNRNHTNVIFVTLTECPYTYAANGRGTKSAKKSR